MPYTAPATVVTGTTITSAWGNSVKAGMDYQANPPACRAYHNTTQTVANVTPTPLALNSERFDTDTMHDTVTNNSRITFNTAGLYVVTAHVELPQRADYTHVVIGIFLNATNYIARRNSGAVNDNTVSPMASVSAIYKFAVGNYIQAYVVQENTAAATVTVPLSSGYECEFSAVWVGLG